MREMEKTMASAAMAKPKKSKKAKGKKPEKKSKHDMKGKRVREVHVRRGASGGYIERHDYDQHPEGKTTDEHVRPDMDSVLASLQAHMGDMPGAGEPPAPASPPAPVVAGKGNPY